MQLAQVRRLWRAGLTPAKVGRAQWRRQVTEPTSVTPRPRHKPILTLESYRAAAERNRRHATEAEIEYASKMARERVCGACGGVGFLMDRAPGSRTGRPVWCSCVPLTARAAASGIPPRYTQATLETFKPLPEKTRALEWCKQWDGKQSVLLVGATWGTGKTHLGVGLLMKALEDGKRVRFTPVPTFLDEVKARFDSNGEQAHAYAERIANEPILMLDDLGQERATEWTRGELRKLFETRWAKQLTTIVTTNLETESALADYVGGAVASRLKEATWLRVAGQDMRGAS